MCTGERISRVTNTSIARKAKLASFLAVLAMVGCRSESEVDRIERGAAVYAAHCSSCHGEKREGQLNWREKTADGTRPAAPALNDSGNVWSYKDRQLFTIVKNGYVPPYTKPGRESDMPGFRDRLSDDEIHAVLDFIRASWSEETKKKRAELLIKRTKRH